MITTTKQKLIIPTTAVIGISLLYFFVDAREGDFFPHCPFHSLTGLYCPGCGSQRALSALLHLDLASAIKHNVLMVASLPFILYSAIVLVHNAISNGRKLQQKLFYTKWFVYSTLVLVVLFGILRNIEVVPFSFLAPH